jgi:hypothetical protein
MLNISSNKLFTRLSSSRGQLSSSSFLMVSLPLVMGVHLRLEFLRQRRVRSELAMGILRLFHGNLRRIEDHTV